MSLPASFAMARLIAERLREEHAAEIHRMHQDAVHMATLGGVRSEAETVAYMTRNLDHWERYGFGVWMMRDRQDGRVAGRALLRHLLVEGTDEIEVGYSFYPAYWGQGLAAEAAGACLDLARESLVLLADAMNELGDEFAIHGFTSNGRRDVSYFRYKDFGVPYGPQAKAALAGITPLLSTRMGPAIRHAGEFLRAQPSGRKLLLVITDGEPSDIDIHDPRYLMMDAKKACEGLMRHGIQPFCMSLDPRADKYVSTIFGRRNYLVMDKIARLPEKLPLIYLRMTQH